MSSDDDIVARLRAVNLPLDDLDAEEAAHSAADEITRLRADLAALKVNEGYCTELCCTAQTCFDAVVMQRDAARADLAAARELMNDLRTFVIYKAKGDFHTINGMLARIDAALKGDGDDNN